MRQQSVQWQQVIDHAMTLRPLLGTHLAQLSSEERQAMAPCLRSTVIVTRDEVDVHCLLPFDSTPQVAQRLRQAPEGTPGHFYRLRLAYVEVPCVARSRAASRWRIGIGLAGLAALLADRFIGYGHATDEEQFFHIAVAERAAKREPDGMTDTISLELECISSFHQVGIASQGGNSRSGVALH
jgi:hypothetical protein